MTGREQMKARLVSETFNEVVQAVNMGDIEAAYLATRELFHMAVKLRRAQIAAATRRRSARRRTQAMRDLGLVRAPFGWE